MMMMMMMMKVVKIVPKSTEWTSLLVSVLLEGVSATLDQLGFALLGMIMAFIGLFFSVVDLILKCQQKRLIWVVGSSFLPCFRRNFSSKGKRFDSLVAYFGTACAAWQCLYSTTGYVYAQHNLGNPIRMCLLPFVSVSCVGITQFIRNAAPSDKKSQATKAQTEAEIVTQSTPQLQHSFHFPSDRKIFNKKQQAVVISVGEESSNNALKIAVEVSGKRVHIQDAELRDSVGFAKLTSVGDESMKKAMVWRNGAHVPNNVFDQFSHRKKNWQNDAFQTWPAGAAKWGKEEIERQRFNRIEATGYVMNHLFLLVSTHLFSSIQIQYSS